MNEDAEPNICSKKSIPQKLTVNTLYNLITDTCTGLALVING